MGRTVFSVLLVMLAADWPQWRGPDRDGVAPGLAPRASWPRTLAQAWKTPVGVGHSSPIVVGSSIFLHTREGEDEFVSRFDLATGRRVWRQTYRAPYTMNPAAWGHGKGPKSTPVAQKGRLFTLGISGILSCFETETGRLLWRKDFRGQFRETSPLYGAAMSPVVDGDLLIAHVGGHDDGALTAFDTATGDVKWAWKGDGPGYASPVVADLGGRRQVVTQTQGYVVGVGLESGELLWKIPLQTDYEQNAVTPVIHGPDVIYSGLGKGVHAVRIAKRGNAWAAEKQWENLDLSMYMSSPVLDGDRLYGFSHRQKGQAFCLDARTGRTLWAGPGRQGDNAALIRSGSGLFLLTTDAQLIVARADAAAYAPLATYALAPSPTWAHPVILAGGFLVKDADTLALWRVE